HTRSKGDWSSDVCSSDLEEMEDPRHPSYITYSQSDLFYMGLMKNLCGVKTMHAMEEQFNEENCIETLRILSGDKSLSEMPHSDRSEERRVGEERERGEAR